MSCADVCVVMDWDGGNDFYHEVERRAAKQHQCCECGDSIVPGVRYQYAAGKAEGDVFDAKTCLPCAEVRKVFCCEGWIFGMLWESIDEQVFPGWDDMKAIDCLSRLKTDAAVAKMRERYAKWRKDNDD